MKIFIDSADLDEIKQAYEWGIADGITTNPSLMKKAVDKHKNVNLKQYITKILKIAKNTPVSLEVTETSAKKLSHKLSKVETILTPLCYFFFQFLSRFNSSFQ